MYSVDQEFTIHTVLSIDHSKKRPYIKYIKLIMFVNPKGCYLLSCMTVSITFVQVNLINRFDK